MVPIVLKNNCFEFNLMIKQHTLDAGIETNFAPRTHVLLPIGRVQSL